MRLIEKTTRALELAGIIKFLDLALKPSEDTNFIKDYAQYAEYQVRLQVGGGLPAAQRVTEHLQNFLPTMTFEIYQKAKVAAQEELQKLTLEIKDGLVEIEATLKGLEE